MSTSHANSRLEAFCDGVFAIALTLLIIEVKPPDPEHVTTTAGLWSVLQHLASSSISAFVLSFGIILITWVNHHAMLELIPKTCASFVYANGFLLLTVVFIPFPTALLAEFLWTDRASPPVVLYNAVLAVQALAWVLVTSTALGNNLTTDARSAAKVREGLRNGYVAFTFYSLLAISAVWIPTTTAAVTTASWIFWLVMGIRLKRA